jgi:hypothetical protein
MPLFLTQSSSWLPSNLTDSCAAIPWTPAGLPVSTSWLLLLPLQSLPALRPEITLWTLTHRLFDFKAFWMSSVLWTFRVLLYTCSALICTVYLYHLHFALFKIVGPQTNEEHNISPCFTQHQGFAHSRCAGCITHSKLTEYAKVESAKDPQEQVCLLEESDLLIYNEEVFLPSSHGFPWGDVGASFTKCVVKLSSCWRVLRRVLRWEEGIHCGLVAVFAEGLEVGTK